LELEESTMLQRSARDSGNSSNPAALVAKNQSPDITHTAETEERNRGGRSGGNRSKKSNRGGRNSGGRGGRNGGSPFSSNGGRMPFSGGGGRGQNPWQQWYQNWNTWQHWAPWNAPPCPYPTSHWNKPNNTPKAQQNGVLGPGPQQAAFSVNTPSPTDIENAIHTLSFAQQDPSWYMDTGATSHMTSSQGNLSSYFKLSKNNKIIVGNGHSVPIHGLGSTHIPLPNPPFILKNVLHAPNLIKNLVSVRKFTTDNKVSIEFDPFGFSVKDIQTGMALMRCESKGDLYPITTNTTSTNKAKPTSTFAALSSSLWHDRLGHPGEQILNSLRQNKFIECNNSRKLH
jgi:hypothetical protein